MKMSKRVDQNDMFQYKDSKWKKHIGISTCYIINFCTYILKKTVKRQIYDTNPDYNIGQELLFQLTT